MERNLLDVLRCHSENRTGNIAFQILDKNGERVDEVNYGSLWEISSIVAAGISARCQRGDRVIISLPTGLNYIYAFLGCLISGVIAVPFYPVKNRNKAKLLADIINSCEASLVVTSFEDCENLGLLLGELELDLQVASAEGLVTPSKSSVSTYEREDEHSVAYIQYTSGSTSKPKGVSISNSNIYANAEYLTNKVGGTNRDVFVNWLPLYHDMGLVITVLWPIYLGAKSILMAASCFVSNPFMWLKVISDNRGTICGGPNFCYELCLEKIAPSSLSLLNLSSWEIAFNSAEPVLEKTVRRFSSYFMVAGFNEKALYPCYGMAEATVFISGKMRHSGYSSLCIDKEKLSKNKLEFVDPDSGKGTEIVSCGGVCSPHSFKILGTETKAIMKDLEIGEICVNGPSIFRDYWSANNDHSDYRNGNDIIIDDVSYFRTGDIGFSFKGDLYITGRLKDIIIMRGKNYYPNDIENSVFDSHYTIRRGGCAVFALHSEDQYELVGVVELKKEFFKDTNMGVLAGIVRKHVLSDQNVYLDNIVFTRPHSIPLTSSGKVQRSKVATLYQSGALKGCNVKDSPLALVTSPCSNTEIEITRIWCAVLKRDVISMDSDYFEIGGSSIEAIEILSKIHDAFPQIEIKQDILIKYSNIASLAKFIDVCLLRNASSKDDKSTKNLIRI